MNMFSEVAGWLGVAFSILVSLPQISKSLKTRSTEGVSLRTYQMLFCMVLCYLIRALVIQELIFIMSNAVTLCVTVSMLYLFKKYPERPYDKC